MWTKWTDISASVAVPNKNLVFGSPSDNLKVTWIVLMLILADPPNLSASNSAVG